MNIIDAIKSGKRFRRKSWIDKRYLDNNSILHFPIEAIIADDWEVETGTVAITREQFDAAWDNALIGIGTRLDRDAVAKELGL